INPVTPTPVPPPTTTPSSGGSGGSLGFLSLLGLAVFGRLSRSKVRYGLQNQRPCGVGNVRGE
ncbi:GlyGly-CTERM sorting domain-containing protein, partial [Vibrio splendidus]|uniref:GlyGly-CTERM sorting domain-containing protein n=1 Tax=Vibrio splendidus TaxID=29497 RepID=UPI001112EF9B